MKRCLMIAAFVLLASLRLSAQDAGAMREGAREYAAADTTETLSTDLRYVPHPERFDALPFSSRFAMPVFGGQYAGVDGDGSVSALLPFLDLSEPGLPFGLVGSSSQAAYLGMGNINRARLGYEGAAGRLSYGAYLGADKYWYGYNITNNFILGGYVDLTLNDQWSLSAFGRFASNPYVSAPMTALVTATSYGATVNYRSDNFSLRTGVRRTFDPITGRMEIYPIVMPSVKIGNFSVGVDVGPAMKEGVMRAAGKNRIPPPPPTNKR